MLGVAVLAGQSCDLMTNTCGNGYWVTVQRGRFLDFWRRTASVLFKLWGNELPVD